MDVGAIQRLVRAVGPVAAEAVKSGQFFRPACELFEPPDDVSCEYGVPIPRENGTTLTANIYQSKAMVESGDPTPVVMCAHPYDNSLLPALGKTPFGGPPFQYRMTKQSGGTPRVSTITSWESPDPAFWVPNGYAVVNLNLPGYATSEGTPTMFAPDQGDGFYEAIEWVGQQPWCNGNVGLSGVSFLAISQYYVAFNKKYGGPPRALKCISPWEGISDPFHDLFRRGGIREIGFANFWWFSVLAPVLGERAHEFVEAEGGKPAEFVDRHPFHDEYWKSKVPDLESIDLPMLVCGSFSDHNLHTDGTFRAFMRARSDKKWLYTHRTGKWVSYYSDEVLELTKSFMDCFLKHDGRDDFAETPPVRLEVRSTGDCIHEVRREQEWPLARTSYTRLYLDENGALATEAPTGSSEVSHDARRGRSSFSHTFREDTELTGHMKLTLWVEARSAKRGKPIDDVALFVAVDKLDERGQSVRFQGTVGIANDTVTRGQALASWRQLDADASTEWLPVLSGARPQRLRPGEVVRVDMPLCPSSTFFAKGESIRLIVSAQELVPTRPFIFEPPHLSGRAVVHTGGDRDSHLLIPVIPLAHETTVD